jgi:hypothetical protein
VSPPTVRRFQFASNSVTVISEVLAPSEAILIGDATIAAFAADAAPGTNSTVAAADARINMSFTLNETTLSPATVEDVSVAEYVPSPLSVVPEMVPALGSNTTVSPPDTNWFPFPSNSVTVISEVLTPSAVILVGDATIVDVDPDASPGKNTTEAVAVASVLFTVNDTTLVSATVEDVNSVE